eukprot:TRINITY_DN27445_c0_g1_i1.p1 TRINITY_DN27445_c0_g1~~TRINITY_DN27445_c0_g1_i1.p1  ORF type:complete len:378 (+),score=87.53 TRINITY_DN27445_c0_g1_i1:50-1135(+)
MPRTPETSVHLEHSAAAGDETSLEQTVGSWTDERNSIYGVQMDAGRRSCTVTTQRPNGEVRTTEALLKFDDRKNRVTWGYAYFLVAVGTTPQEIRWRANNGTSKDFVWKRRLGQGLVGTTASSAAPKAKPSATNAAPCSAAATVAKAGPLAAPKAASIAPWAASGILAASSAAAKVGPAAVPKAATPAPWAAGLAAGTAGTSNSAEPARRQPASSGTGRLGSAWESRGGLLGHAANAELQEEEALRLAIEASLREAEALADVDINQEQPKVMRPEICFGTLDDEDELQPGPCLATRNSAEVLEHDAEQIVKDANNKIRQLSQVAERRKATETATTRPAGRENSWQSWKPTHGCNRLMQEGY